MSAQTPAVVMPSGSPTDWIGGPGKLVDSDVVLEESVLLFKN